MLFVISIVPFLSAVTIAFLNVSEFWIRGRLFQALMLLGRNENLYASVLARSRGWCTITTIQCVEYVRHVLA